MALNSATRTLAISFLLRRTRNTPPAAMLHEVDEVGKEAPTEHAMDMLEDVERRNPWSTAQELLEMVDNGDLKLPDETVSNFRRLIQLHERSIDHERILEMTNQGLQLERCG